MSASGDAGHTPEPPRPDRYGLGRGPGPASGADRLDPLPAPGGGLVPALIWLGALALSGGALWLAFDASGWLGPRTGVAGTAAQLGGVAALALALTTPFALHFGFARQARRAEALDARLAALARDQAAHARNLPRIDKPAADAAPNTQDLARAVAAAARAALDGERAAIARQIAEIGEAQRLLGQKIDALPALTAPPGIAAPAQPAPAAAAAAQAPPAQAPPAQAAAARSPAAQPRPTIPAAPPRARAAPLAETAQASLPLSDDPPAPALDWPTIATALNFPRDESDEQGFAALRTALRDPAVSDLLQAAEDTLTMLAQNGIYMEDLEARLAPAAAWARFAHGARGPEVAAVGGIVAPEAVEQVRAMMKSDPIFRDTAMHLMRRFDGVLRKTLDDPRAEAQLPVIADTRTGRAFMLVAQTVGAFD